MSIVLMLKDNDAVYLGVDSKVVAASAATKPTDAPPRPKIHIAQGVAFANVGIFNDTHRRVIDVERTAEDSIAQGGDLSQVAERFAEAIQEPLAATLCEIRTKNPSYFGDDLHRPLEILFASMNSGKAEVIVILFEVQNMLADKLSFRVKHMSAPGGGIATIGLGVHDAADQWLSEHESLCRTNPLDGIRDAIQFQASSTPSLVSLPISLASLDDHGFRRFGDNQDDRTQPVAPDIVQPRFRFRLAAGPSSVDCTIPQTR